MMLLLLLLHLVCASCSHISAAATPLSEQAEGRVYQFRLDQIRLDQIRLESRWGQVGSSHSQYLFIIIFFFLLNPFFSTYCKCIHHKCNRGEGKVEEDNLNCNDETCIFASTPWLLLSSPTSNPITVPNLLLDDRNKLPTDIKEPKQPP